ncbi:phosphoinositide phospholipase C 2-like isoform X2 [Rutidosis leptorrhynchoides]|uniref:phosphoinositide phospholipase C 2-like isoform X2 n=1 Tax=Rutidosis leptorrhynchoides TaxID=125765 RepID=UPI003A999073
MSKQTYKFCLCFRRRFKLGVGGPPDDVKDLFSRYSDNGVMTSDHLQRFMVEVQGDHTATKEDAEVAIDATIKEMKHLPIFHRRVLNLDAFFRYLFGESNLPLPFPPKMVTETYGDVLYTYTGTDAMKDFPSPESLKKRIVVSTKPPKEYLDTTKSMKEHDEDSVKINASAEEDVWGVELSDPFEKQKLIDEDHKDEDFQYEEETVKQNVEPEYKQLIAIQAKKLKGGVKDWLHDDPTAAKRISLRETRLEKAIENHAADVIRFTQRNLLRVFPKGSRVDSSNYNPLIGWTHGAQMVAFNMQTHGRSLWLMQGMFRANGGCGYVKKPDFLLENGDVDKIFDPKATLPVKKTLKVKVYMGDGWHLDFKRTHFDVYSPPDFYVKVGIAGVGADSMMKKTKIIQDDWIPKWEEEFEFPLTVPELALLRVEVHEYDMTEKDDFGGQTCLPVFELRSGIRAVPLHDEKGNKYKSVKLLMRFEFV